MNDDLGREWMPEGQRLRKVLISHELMVQIAEATSGKRVAVEWGQPDRDGFYTPTITVHEDKENA